MTIFLLADRKLPTPPDAIMYPDLKLYPVDVDNQAEPLAGIRRVTPAAFAYDVRPGGYCGCYFCHDTQEAFLEHLAERRANPEVEYVGTLEEAEAMWQCQTNALRSFGRYLSTQADAALAVYAVWEHCAGQKEPTRANVPASYFDGPGFNALPEDVLLTIIPEAAGGESWPWNPAAPRTHKWLGCCDPYDEMDDDNSDGNVAAE